MSSTPRHPAIGVVSAVLLALAAACTDGTSPDTPQRPDYVAVAAGEFFTCALTSDRRTYCWGEEYDGSWDSVPALLSTPVPLVRITAAGRQMCGIGESGVAYCWRGMWCCYDTSISYADGRTAVAMADSLRFVSLSASAWHVCGLTTDSLAVCWGDYDAGKRGQGPDWIPPPDFYGGLGNTADLNANAVVGALKFRTLAAGSYHTCGVLGDGQLACWGDSLFVGNPGAAFSHGDTICGLSLTDACAAQPVLGPTLTGVSLLAAGVAHTCTLASQGLRCWGSNDALQLGVPGDIGGAPSLVTLPAPVTALDAGGVSTCALLNDGAAWCWGAKSVDEAGNYVDETTLPERVPFEGRFIAVSTSGSHTCGISDRARIFCWGTNLLGQLGDGSTRPSGVPVEVAPPRS